MSSADWPWYEIVNDDSLDQGDIIPGCLVLHAVEGENRKAVAELRPVTALVVTQACDLAQSKADSVILCAVWPVTTAVIQDRTLAKEAKDTAGRNNLTMPASADVAGAEAQIDKIIEKSKALKKEQQLPIGEHRGHPLGSRLAMPEAKNGCSTPWQKRGRRSDVAPFDVSISNGHTL